MSHDDADIYLCLQSLLNFDLLLCPPFKLKRMRTQASGSSLEGVFQGEAVKPGLDWSLDSGLDWTRGGVGAATFGYRLETEK